MKFEATYFHLESITIADQPLSLLGPFEYHPSIANMVALTWSCSARYGQISSEARCLDRRFDPYLFFSLTGGSSSKIDQAYGVDVMVDCYEDILLVVVLRGNGPLLLKVAPP